MEKGRIIILSGPSGSGKTTLHNKLLSSRKFKNRIVKSLSATTRPKRKGERHGRDYLFYSKRMFLYKKRAGHFLETQKVFGHYYGTPNRYVQTMLKKGKHVLLCIDVMGAKIVRKKYISTLKIFIKAPSAKVLKKRLKKRETERASSLSVRMQRVQKEMKEARHYDHVIINDNLQKACRKLEDVICNDLNY